MREDFRRKQVSENHASAYTRTGTTNLPIGRIPVEQRNKTERQLTELQIGALNRIKQTLSAEQYQQVLEKAGWSN